MNSLDALKASGTLVVADSGDLKKLAATGAIDATTNVSRSVFNLLLHCHFTYHCKKVTFTPLTPPSFVSLPLSLLHQNFLNTSILLMTLLLTHVTPKLARLQQNVLPLPLTNSL